MVLNVYLSGEIHTSWREEIMSACKEAGLDINFNSPITVHEDSDAAGDHLGNEDKQYWRVLLTHSVSALVLGIPQDSC